MPQISLQKNSPLTVIWRSLNKILRKEFSIFRGEEKHDKYSAMFVAKIGSEFGAEIAANVTANFTTNFGGETKCRKVFLENLI